MFGDIIVIIVLLVIIYFAVKSLRSHKSSCSGNCTSCGCSGGSCHSHDEDSEK